MDILSNQSPTLVQIMQKHQVEQHFLNQAETVRDKVQVPIAVGQDQLFCSGASPEQPITMSNMSVEDHHETNKAVALASLGTPKTNAPKYDYSSVYGGKQLIYNFEAPQEYLQDHPLNGSDHNLKDALVYYFSNLYPLSDESNWSKMSDEQLLEYYRGLDFWYTFNTSWGVSPKPVVFDDYVLGKWEKNTFYQAGTIIQSSITSLGWDYDSNGEKFRYAARYNNAAQIDPVYKWNNKSLRTVCRDKDLWESMRGKKIEVTSWGWNPYPFGMYSQGPFRGTGNFLELPTDFVVGTCHWAIIMANKANHVTRQDIFKVIIDHELSRASPGPISNGKGTTYIPELIIHNMDTNEYYWGKIQVGGKPGFTPILMSYSCYLIGGFGGAGGLGSRDDWHAWYPSSSNNIDGKSNYQYAPLVELKNGRYTIPADQSISPNFLKGFKRDSETMWNEFDKMFSLMERWDTNFAKNIWRHPDFPVGGFGPSVANACDDLMQAYVTGNFDFVRYSLWGKTNPDPSLCKNTPNALTYSSKLEDGEFKGFPYGYVTGGSAPSFVVRTQMPNLNGDICLEFADFRVCTPGQLATGSGNQQEWKDLILRYAEKYYFTVDPHNPSNYHSFSDDYAPWIPDVEEKSAKMDVDDFSQQDNPLTGKTFFDFDTFMGTWIGELAYTSQKDALKQYPMNTEDFSLNSWEWRWSKQQGNWVAVNLYNTCTAPKPALVPTPTPSTNVYEIAGAIDCVKDKPIIQTNKNLTQTNDTYYPFATDSFKTGVVGFQGDNLTASIGACQTRWWYASKKIAWKMDAPLANRLALQTGMRLKKTLGENSEGIDTRKTLPVIGIVLSILAASVMLYLGTKRNDKRWYIGVLISVVCLALSIMFFVSADHQDQAQKLRLYFTLVYPRTPISKWKSMSYEELKSFFLTLHFWYRATDKLCDMPSPIDYLNDPEWNGTPPFGPGTSWKNWSIRKKCMIGYPQVKNPYDGRIVVGNDGEVGMNIENAPSCILFRGRQLLSSEGAGIQHSSFFTPAENFYIDTYDCMAGVNDTSLESWKKAKYAEVSSQWGPFPDGSYYDWAQGSGVFMKLGKNAVGYSGMHLVYILGDELMAQPNYIDKMEDVYFQEWQRTGLNGMTMQGKMLVNPVQGKTQGMYGSIIFTQVQRNQVINKLGQNQYPVLTYGDNFLADGNFWSKVNKIINDPTPYYDAKKGEWVADIPENQKQYYVKDYPFPLPFGTGKFTESKSYEGHAQMYEPAMTMKWKYQCFNIANMFRQMTVDMLFLDESLADGSGVEQEYVDFLMANAKNPLSQPRTWKDAIDKVVKILGTSPPHPILFKYNRVLDAKDLTKSLTGDGPAMVIDAEQDVDFSRAINGALDKKSYLQDTKTAGGTILNDMNSLPQMMYANLEIDHWMSELARKLNYDTIQRIQHWSGSKNMSADIELINLHVPIPGNLIDNTLDANIYEIWKEAFGSGHYVLRDPFDPNSHVYHREGNNITSDTEDVKCEWVRPPWIGMNADGNLYGWPCESLATYGKVNRLAYPQISAMQIGLSNAYPEFNHYLWYHYTDKYLGKF